MAAPSRDAPNDTPGLGRGKITGHVYSTCFESRQVPLDHSSSNNSMGCDTFGSATCRGCKGVCDLAHKHAINDAKAIFMFIEMSA